MIVGERILEVSGNKSPNTPIKGLSININLGNVEKKDDLLEITYIYTANYEKDAGQLTIKGLLLAREEEKRINEVLDTWKKTKKIPNDYAETVLSAVNYSGSANGTLMARVLGLTAPLIPPRIQLKQDAAKTAKK